MPSIALFIKQLLSEDKYSSDFNDRIGERIKELNAAQLQGIYNHLVNTAKNAKSQTWVAANRELIDKIEGLMHERVAEAQKVDKILEEEYLKQAQKKRKQKEAKIEQKRVMKMIVETARKTAEDAVRQEEMKKTAENKIEVMAKVFQGEEKRNDMLKKVAVGFVVGIVVVSVASPSLIFLLPGLFFVCLVTGILCYQAQQLTVVKPRVVDEAELELEIERRSDVLKKKAISALQEKERKFQEQQARDEEERRQRKALKKKQAKFEADLMARRRQQQLAQAQEILGRRGTPSVASVANSMSNMSGRDTPLSARTEITSYRGSATTSPRGTMSRQISAVMPTIPDSERDSDEGSQAEAGDSETRRNVDESMESRGESAYEHSGTEDGDSEGEVQLWGDVLKVEGDYGEPPESSSARGKEREEHKADVVNLWEQEHILSEGEELDRMEAQHPLVRQSSSRGVVRPRLGGKSVSFHMPLDDSEGEHSEIQSGRGSARGSARRPGSGSGPGGGSGGSGNGGSGNGGSVVTKPLLESRGGGSSGFGSGLGLGFGLTGALRGSRKVHPTSTADSCDDDDVLATSTPSLAEPKVTPADEEIGVLVDIEEGNANNAN